MIASLALATPRGPRLAALPLLGLLLAAALVAGVTLGPARVSPAGLLAVLADALGLAALPAEFARDAAILGVVRAPRVLLAAIVGAGLGAAGAAMQGLFRNPLADPGLIGVSAGAALAALCLQIDGRVHRAAPSALRRQVKRGA